MKFSGLSCWGSHIACVEKIFHGSQILAQFTRWKRKDTVLELPGEMCYEQCCAVQAVCSNRERGSSRCDKPMNDADVLQLRPCHLTEYTFGKGICIRQGR